MTKDCVDSDLAELAALDAVPIPRSADRDATLPSFEDKSVYLPAGGSRLSSEWPGCVERGDERVASDGGVHPLPKASSWTF